MAETIKFHARLNSLPIEVNDNGDCITIPLSDERFKQNLMEFSTDISKKAERLDSLSDITPIELMDENIKFHEDIKTGFNKLFGSGSYEALFGEILVGAESVLEFLEFILPHIRASEEERFKKLTSKYSADRTGSTD